MKGNLGSTNHSYHGHGPSLIMIYGCVIFLQRQQKHCEAGHLILAVQPDTAQTKSDQILTFFDGNLSQASQWDEVVGYSRGIMSCSNEPLSTKILAKSSVDFEALVIFSKASF